MMLGRIKKLVFGGSEESMYFKQEDNTGLDCQDKMGTMIESPYEGFSKGDSISVKPQNNHCTILKTISDKQVFVRGKNVYPSKEICPKHEIKKFRDEKLNEYYCPKCE